MTNWKTCRIVNRRNEPDGNSWIRFDLDDYISYRTHIGGTCNEKHIYCVNRSPFDDYCPGDYLEIDLDETSSHSSSVRRVTNPTSTALVRVQEQNSSL